MLFSRPVYYYRGNELMAIRYGLYKAHLWTWTNGMDEFNKVNILTMILSLEYYINVYNIIQ